MIFKVTASDLFYTPPSADGLCKAEETVTNICRERIITAYNGRPTLGHIVSAWLDAELEKMHTTGTGFRFLILHDIAQCSREAGYPIIALGNFSGSWIAYLLGVTEKGPLPCYTPEIVWGTDTNPITPDCTIGIAPPVRPLLQKYLDAQHGYIECDRDMFRRISLADSNTCEQLGTLTQKTGQYPSICDLDDAVYSRVANDIAAEFLNENKEAISLVIEALQTESWGFRSLLRLYAFTKSKFKKETYLTNLNAPDFFVSKEELFFCLKHHNVPTDIALEFVKEGIWARGSKRAKYTALLELYEIPKNIKYYFTNVNNLWMMSSCATRLLHKCYLAWYQEHYPDAFM